MQSIYPVVCQPRFCKEDLRHEVSAKHVQLDELLSHSSFCKYQQSLISLHSGCKTTVFLAGN